MGAFQPIGSWHKVMLPDRHGIRFARCWLQTTSSIALHLKGYQSRLAAAVH